MPEIIEFAASLDGEACRVDRAEGGATPCRDQIRDWVSVVRSRRREWRPPTAVTATGVADGLFERAKVYVCTDEFETNDGAAAALARLPYIFERSFSLVDVTPGNRRP